MGRRADRGHRDHGGERADVLGRRHARPRAHRARGDRRPEARIGALSRDLTRSREEAARWREEAQQALQGLGAAIDRQFARWELTPAEREVALLLLKGLSLKEVADVRGTSERTAREQARAGYRKAGLSGRSELSAFFLEDLLLPEAEPVGAASRRGA